LLTRRRDRNHLAAAANRGLMDIYRLPLAANYAGSVSENHENNGLRSILIVRGDAIGDFVLFLPSITALRQYYEGSRISLLTGRESLPLALSVADVDEVIAFDAKRYRFDLGCRIRLIRQLRSRCFDIALNPIYSREPLTDELLYCSGAKERITFDGNLDNIDARTKAANDRYCTQVIASGAGIVSEVERNREFVEKLTGRKPTLEASLPRIPITGRQIEEARRHLLDEGVDPDAETLVVLFPGASSAIKMWPSERFADVANRVAKEYKVRILICGSPSDVETQEAVASRVSAPVVRLAGKTDLLQLVGILKHAALFIGNDTGPLHLAAAVGTPTLCVLGGGHFGRFYPYGDQRKHRAVFHELECFHCNWICPFETAHCIHNVTVEQVWQVVRHMFGEILPPSLNLNKPSVSMSEATS
jgi:ADP-heptose:LPS heptosyltransferase